MAHKVDENIHISHSKQKSVAKGQSSCQETGLPRRESKLCTTERNLNGKQQQWGKFSLGMFRRPRHGCLISTWPVPCAQSTCNLPDHGTRALTQQCNARWIRGLYNSDSIRTCGATNGPTQFITGRNTQCWITGWKRRAPSDQPPKNCLPGSQHGKS